MLVTEWVTRDILVTVKARVDSDPRNKIYMIVQKQTTLDELSIAIKNAVDMMAIKDANKVAHSLLWVNYIMIYIIVIIFLIGQRQPR